MLVQVETEPAVTWCLLWEFRRRLRGKRERNTTETRDLAFKKVMRTFTNIKKDLVMQSSICKKGTKRRSDIDDEIYLVVMMSALYPVDIDIILDYISLLFSQTLSSSDVTSSSLYNFKWWTQIIYLGFIHMDPFI